MNSRAPRAKADRAARAGEPATTAVTAPLARRSADAGAGAMGILLVGGRRGGAPSRPGGPGPVSPSGNRVGVVPLRVTEGTRSGAGLPRRWWTDLP
ncbi:hypothetical protein GCM10007073_12740 [Micrococcus flavus]|nr:hypothetical protein GCM10007073_12740 [Micrococcus flavus]